MKIKQKKAYHSEVHPSAGEDSINSSIDLVCDRLDIGVVMLLPAETLSAIHLEEERTELLRIGRIDLHDIFGRVEGCRMDTILCPKPLDDGLDNFILGQSNLSKLGKFFSLDFALGTLLEQGAHEIPW